MKVNIKHKVLGLVVTAGLVTSLLLFAVLVWCLNTAENTLGNESKTIALGISQEAANFAEMQAKKRLEGIVFGKAYQMEAVLTEIEGDVLIMSAKMTQMMKNPSNSQMMLPKDPAAEPIYSGDVFFLPGPSGRRPAEVMNYAANLQSTVSLLSKDKEYLPVFFFAGSQEGWSLRIDYLGDKKGQIVLPEEALTTAYDVRQRPWYQTALTADEDSSPIYVPMYIATGGSPLMAVVLPYYDDKGIVGVVGMSFSSDVLRKFLQIDTLDDEISFALNPAGQIVFSSNQTGVLAPNRPDFDLRKAADTQLAEAARHMINGESGAMTVDVDGKKYYLVYAPIGKRGWSLGELVNVNEVQDPAGSIGAMVENELQTIEEIIVPSFDKTKQMAVWAFAVLIVLLVIASIHFAKHFSQPIKDLAEGVSHIASGNFEDKLEVKTGDELELLALRFNDMTLSLKKYMRDLADITAEQAKSATELELAARIQQGLLPAEAITGQQVDVTGYMEPAIEVGGDFYDYYFLDEQHLAITIADVSDKGVPSAIFMVVAKTILHNVLPLYYRDSLAEALSAANEQLAEVNDEDLFVTVWAGVLDLASGKLEYVSCGHSSPVFVHDGKITTLAKSKNPVLGIMPGIEFRQQSTMLPSDSLLFMYTDGVTEAMNEQNQMFTGERMEKVLEMAADDNAAEVIAKMKTAVKGFTGQAKQFDDITMVALKYYHVDNEPKMSAVSTGD